jgi:hypothetical protein
MIFDRGDVVLCPNLKCPDFGGTVTPEGVYCFLRNGAFYWRWPEKLWLLDESLATAFAAWQRAGGTPLGFNGPKRPMMRWQRAGKHASATQHTGVQRPLEGRST